MIKPDDDVPSNPGTSYLKSTARRVVFEEGPTKQQTVSTTRTSPGGNSASVASSRERLDAYNERLQLYTPWEREHLLPALAWRSYHVPGNNWCEDWLQYFRNTHPIFGICCHHRKHPVGWPMRLLTLLGSFVFGLMVTNLVWIFLIIDENVDEDRTVISLTMGGINATRWTQNDVINNTLLNNTFLSGEEQTVEVTEGMILLWTVGGLMHALFDNTIWHLAACPCCLPGASLEAFSGVRRYGKLFIFFFLIAIAIVSSMLVIVRASLSEKEELIDIEALRSAGATEDEIAVLTSYEDKESFQFLASYCIELTLSLLFWFPTVGTVLFSGVLCCGRLPIVGGRPYEVRREQMLALAKERKCSMREVAPGPSTITISGNRSCADSQLSMDEALEMTLEFYEERKYKQGY